MYRQQQRTCRVQIWSDWSYFATCARTLFPQNERFLNKSGQTTIFLISARITNGQTKLVKWIHLLDHLDLQGSFHGTICLVEGCWHTYVSTKNIVSTCSREIGLGISIYMFSINSQMTGSWLVSHRCPLQWLFRSRTIHHSIMSRSDRH